MCNISEHIKTGAELYNIGKYKPEMMIKDGLHFAISKWVSLEWLLNYIQTEIDRKASIGYSSSGLNELQSRLETEAKNVIRHEWGEKEK